ncbi:tetratricopeptide repeat protein [Fulvivirgaceae bacterium PWU4]|uniref:histidine kinase n=1 Tax=Chryseosolibacter histidini TaxID=2782349 RepID=A0AAP2GHL1_9BACT|nr:tetratricopeptide repeat protein [Chryseosolibacter histidini]MBT1696174.1 tetratricopeptide repeat protein [Chryseosolibacter histidini]
MKFVCWLLLTVGLPAYCHAQQTLDMLKTKLDSSTLAGDPASTAYYQYLIGYHFSQQKKYDSALYYYHQAISAKDALKEDVKARVFNGLGVVYSKTSLLDSSIRFYDKALKSFMLINDTINAANVEANLCIIYKDLGLYEKALEAGFSQLSKLDKQKPNRALASCYTTIAVVFLKNKDYQDALEYHRMALAVRKQIDYQKGVAQSYNNIGETFLEMQLYDSALANLYRSLKIKRNNDGKDDVASTLSNIGDALLSLNRPEAAEPYLIESLAIKKEFDDRTGQVITLNSLARLKLSAQDLKQAERYLDEAETLVRKTGALDRLRQTLELKITLYKAKGDNTKVLRYADELFVIKDSLLSVEKMESLLEMQLAYETEKKEQQITLLEQREKVNQAEIEAREILISALVIGLILLVIIALLVYKNFLTAKKGKRSVEMLLKELHHRVKNNLQILSSVLSLQSQYLTDENAIHAVKSNEGRVQAMALIHRRLYNENENRNISIKEYVTELVESLVDSYGFHEKNLKLNLNIQDIQVDVDKAIPLGLILNELVSNAFKYAYANQNHPELLVSLNCESSAEMRIMIQDNGDGIVISEQGRESKFGTKMVDTLIKDLKGKYSIEAESGTTYTLNIPLA